MTSPVQLLELPVTEAGKGSLKGVKSRSKTLRGSEGRLLSHFYAGPENRLVSFVCGSSESLAMRGNPLLFVGPSGAGKSELARAVVARQAALTKAKKTLLVTATEFARRFAEAVDRDAIAPFRGPLSECDILVIEDIHLISDKTAAQEELAARLSMRSDHSQLTVLTCRKIPTEVRGLRPILASRMLPGLLLPVAFPGTEARREILRALADVESLAIDEETLRILESALPPSLSVPQLAAAIQQIRLHLRLNNLDRFDGSADAIQAAIAVSAREQKLSIGEITAAVSKRFKLKAADLRGPTRRQQVVRARALAMFLARKLTDLSLQQIGTHFGGRDHTTVMHACRTTEKILGDSPEMARTADEITEILCQTDSE